MTMHTMRYELTEAGRAALAGFNLADEVLRILERLEQAGRLAPEQAERCRAVRCAYLAGARTCCVCGGTFGEQDGVVPMGAGYIAHSTCADGWNEFTNDPAELDEATTSHPEFGGDHAA